ncbi:MAG: transposase [Betaproteobacteria bacterium]|nr:transposase [Betaproteobacteria bacterium]
MQKGPGAGHLSAGKGCGSGVIAGQATVRGMGAVVPPRKNRKGQRSCDRHLYRHRHLVGKAFPHLKRWRGIAARYAKNAASFLAAAHIRCLVLRPAIS